ncbi:MAG: hypothetical protein KFB93_06885 [Simkaniaceae bacterium]|nr:MAG: hypothetical protein KFB93_06885 [Simkaniaceae bacterium]
MSGIDFSIGNSPNDATADYEYSEANVLEVIREEREPSFEESQRIQNRNLSERVSKVEHGIYTYHTIDKVVRVKTLSNQIIQQKVDFWNERRVSSRNRALLGAVGAVVGLFFGFSATSPFGFVVGVCGLGYAAYESIHMTKASKEIDAWKQDPVKEIADQRLEAFKNGLVYIYRQDTGGHSRPQEYQKILSKNELQGLYNQYFHQFRDHLASAHDDKNKLALLSEAARYSPLASHIYRYALLPQEKIDQMEEIRMRYNNFLKAYNSVDDRIRVEINRVNESFKMPIEMIQKEKEELLKPVDARYAATKKELLNLKTAKLEGHPPTGVEIPDYHRQVEREFAERYKAAEETYISDKKEVLKSPNERIKELEAKKKEILSRIHSDRNAQLLPLFPYALALHQEAFKLYKGESFNLMHIHHDPETVFPSYSNRHGPMPRPSAPPMSPDEWQNYARYYDPQRGRH